MPGLTRTSHATSAAQSYSATERYPLTMEASILGPGVAVLAIDVGGTDTKAALVDEAGALCGIVRVRTPLSHDGSADAVLREIERLALSLRSTFPGIVPKACGLLVPGLVDDEAGIGVFSENLGWRNAPFHDRAEAILSMPVSFGHDVRGAGEAEYRLGAAAQFRNVVVMVVGTGIASAIFIDGHPYLAGGHAGEIGHSIVDSAGPRCACGGHGCLEAIASAAAITRRYEQSSGVSVDGAKEVLTRAQAGDTIAIQIWSSAIETLALGLAQTVALLAPDAIVIGGGLAGAGEALFAPLTVELDRVLTFHRRPELLPASIGQDAGLIGAALRARDLLDAVATGS